MSTTSTKVREIRKKARLGWAREEADKLAVKYSSPPIDVLDIAEQSGVDVVFAKFMDQHDRVAGFCDFAGQKLYVNADDIFARQSFTIAHELGHWILHKSLFLEDPEEYQVLPRFQQADVNNPLEQEANTFAANLLVPARLLRPVRYASISTLANLFGVSKMMMEIRVKDKSV